MINRDAAWWDRIATHPEVAPHVFMGQEPVSLAPLVEPETNLPLASEHGGSIFIARDVQGEIFEMHTLFTPEGWGREVATFARRAFATVFERASLILTYEQEGNWRTRPPKSHGWKALGPFRDGTQPRPMRLWGLTREDWSASPIGRKS